jgi:hypothetical protein
VHTAVLATIAFLRVLLLLSSVPQAAGLTKDCHIGSYRLDDDRTVDIAASNGDALRWRMFTGETGQLYPQKNGTWASTYGWTDRPDGKIVSFSGCAEGGITFEKEPGRRIVFDVRDTTFDSSGVKLVARLIMPKSSEKVPVVVLVHGSERTRPATLLRCSGCFRRMGLERSSMTSGAPAFLAANIRRILRFSPPTRSPR